ncbi:MAG: pilus assembly protein CpaE [Nocardioidaceae bacterium]
MITTDLARRLRAAGVQWTPAPGDRFIIPDRDFDDEVFLVSDMVVEVQDLPTGRLLRFNGTAEWALDSIEDDEVIWLPREDQLRALLGQNFVQLEARSGGFIVTVEVNGQRGRHIDVDAERAYARAILATTDPQEAR